MIGRVSISESILSVILEQRIGRQTINLKA